MSIASFMQRLRELGTPPEAIEYAVEQLMTERTRVAEAEAVARAERDALAGRRKADADRQWKRRNPGMSRDVTLCPETSQDVTEQKKGPQTPKENTTNQISTPSAKRVRREKPAGRLCPDDFRPSESHYAKCREHGAPEKVADLTCTKMINWSHGHANRDIAWKADWGRALHQFLDGEIEKWQRQQTAARASPNRKPSSNGALSRVADLMGIPDDQRPDPSVERDHGPVIDHEANGRPYRTVHEPAGRQAGGFQAQAALRLLSAGRG